MESESTITANNYWSVKVSHSSPSFGFSMEIEEVSKRKVNGSFDEDGLLCRFCHCEGEEDDRLIVPCNCKGNFEIRNILQNLIFEL